MPRDLKKSSRIPLLQFFPEVHIQLDYLFGRLPKEEPATWIVATIQLLWLGVFIFQHMQRSVPVKLTLNFFYAVCWKGKNKPGYRWACPRYGPIGADIGGIVWANWQRIPKGLLRRNALRLHVRMREPVPLSFYRISVQPAELSSRSTWACRKLKCSPRVHSGEVCLHLQKCARRTLTMQTRLETGQHPKTPRCASGTPILATRGPSYSKD